MNRTRKRILLCIGLVLLVCWSIVSLRNMQKNRWIAQQVDTQTMHDIRAQTSLRMLKTVRLSPGKTAIDGHLLYSATYYPEARTVLASVNLKGMEKPGFYLVFQDGNVIPGWYTDDLVKYQIAQVAFEGILQEDFASLDFVDQAKIPVTGYNPKDESMPRVSFPLSIPPPPPISWANPASSSAAAIEK